MASVTKREDFEAVFPSLVQDLTDHAKHYGVPTEALEWYKKVGLSASAEEDCLFPASLRAGFAKRIVCTSPSMSTPLAESSIAG